MVGREPPNYQPQVLMVAVPIQSRRGSDFPRTKWPRKWISTARYTSQIDAALAALRADAVWQIGAPPQSVTIEAALGLPGLTVDQLRLMSTADLAEVSNNIAALGNPDLIGPELWACRGVFRDLTEWALHELRARYGVLVRSDYTAPIYRPDDYLRDCAHDVSTISLSTGDIAVFARGFGEGGRWG